jgi:hypothetical protein
MTLPNGPLSPPPACGVPMSPPLVNGDVGKSPLKQVSCFITRVSVVIYIRIFAQQNYSELYYKQNARQPRKFLYKFPLYTCPHNDENKHIRACYLPAVYFLIYDLIFSIFLSILRASDLYHN